MDSTGNPRRSVRKMERDAVEEKKRRKWTVDEAEIGERQQRNFSRLIPSCSSTSDGMMAPMIGKNDIFTDPNLQKIQILQEPEVNPEIKKEVKQEAPSEEEMELEQSTTGFLFELPVVEEASAGAEDCAEFEVTEDIAKVEYSTLLLNEETGEVEDTHELIGLEAASSQNQVPFDVLEDDGSDQIGEVKDNEGADGSGNCGASVGEIECTLCPVLKKKLEEKDQRIRDLERDLDSQKQRIEELSKELEDEKTATASTVDKKRTDDQIRNGENSCPIVSKKSREEIVNSWMRFKVSDNGDSLLHIAAREGNHQLVEKLISIGADVDERNFEGSTPLIFAAKSEKDSSEVIDVLIKNGADLEATNSSGETALFIAIQEGKTLNEIKKLCFEDFSNFESLREHNTVLHEAARGENLETLIYFLSLMPDKINSKNRFGRTPLLCVSAYSPDFWPIVHLLLANGADINSCDDNEESLLHEVIRSKNCVDNLKELVTFGATWNNDKILHVCVESDNVGALEYFIGGGANVNAEDANGSTPLIEALARGRYEAVDILIQSGALGDHSGVHLSAEVNVFERLSRLGFVWNEKVMQRCASFSNLEGIRYCALKGVAVNLKGCKVEIQEPCYWSIEPHPDDMEILEYLFEVGGNVNAVNMEGFNVLHVAASRGCSLRILKRLIGFGATWTNRVVGNGEKKESVLHAAVSGDRPEVVQFFMSKGVDVSCRDSDGFTPLLHAVRKCAGEEMLRVLVKGGADLNAKDNRGRNAVLLGVHGDDKEGVLPKLKALVELGCCCWKVPAENGETVLGFLETSGNSELLSYFKSLG